MKLFEILDYKPEISWKYINDFQLRGFFELDNRKCEIQIDEYEVQDKTLVDFGFIVDGSIQAVEGKKPEAKLLGAVYNGAKDKLKELKPDVVLVSVMKASGLVESRKSEYSSLARILSRTLSFVFDSDWVENAQGFFRIWTKWNLTEEQTDLFISQVQRK